MLGLVGKGEFIRKYGREAWGNLPAYCVQKYGHRAYVERTAVEDNLWLLRADHPDRSIVAVRPKTL